MNLCHTSFSLVCLHCSTLGTKQSKAVLSEVLLGFKLFFVKALSVGVSTCSGRLIGLSAKSPVLDSVCRRSGYNGVILAGLFMCIPLVCACVCVHRVLDVQIAYKIVDRRPGDVGSVYGDPSKATADLGFVASKTLEDMCKLLYG